MTPTWQRPARCSAQNGCAEVLPGCDRVQIRSSLNRSVVATLTPAEWAGLVALVRSGPGEIRPREIEGGDGTVVRFTPGGWSAWLAAIRAGEYDRIGADRG